MPSAPPRFCPTHGTFSEGVCSECDKHRRRHQQGQTGYNLARWLRLRDRFRELHPFCVNADKDVPTCTSLTDVVDHIVPHEGDERLMYDESNLQPMCWSCHSRKTASEVRGRR